MRPLRRLLTWCGVSSGPASHSRAASISALHAATTRRPSAVSAAGNTRRSRGVRRPLNEAFLLECIDDLEHRLRRHVRAARQLRVGQLASPLEDAERRVLERRQPERPDALVDLRAKGTVETRDDIADPRLQPLPLDLWASCRLAHALILSGHQRSLSRMTLEASGTGRGRRCGGRGAQRFPTTDRVTASVRRCVAEVLAATPGAASTRGSR